MNGDLRRCVLIFILKNKGYVQSCDNYRELNLLMLLKSGVTEVCDVDTLRTVRQ